MRERRLTFDEIAETLGYPNGWGREDGPQGLRGGGWFRRLSVVFPVARPLGLAARMTAEQHAGVNIEINEILGAPRPGLRQRERSGPVRARLRSAGIEARQAR